MSMGQSFSAAEWKPADSTGNRWSSQRELPLLGAISSPHRLSADVISRTTFSGALAACLHHDGRSDAMVAAAINISCGYMSKFIRNVGEAWADRLVAFMRETKCVAPLQKLAYDMGYQLEPMKNAAEVEALRARLRELGARA